MVRAARHLRYFHSHGAPRLDAAMRRAVRDAPTNARRNRVSLVRLADGSDAYCRLSRPTGLRAALRHLKTASLVERHGLSVPRRLGAGFVLGRHGLRHAIVEQAIAGAPLSDAALNATTAAALGRDVARWHAIGIGARDRPLFEAPWLQSAGTFAAVFDDFERRGVSETARRLRRDLEWGLSRAAEAAPVLTHADPHGGNMLVSPSGDLHWLDFESVFLNDRRFGLAETTLCFFATAPELVDAFEDSYHAAAGLAAESWRRDRADWFRAAAAQHLLNALHWRLGRDGVAPAVHRWAVLHAALPRPDEGDAPLAAMARRAQDFAAAPHAVARHLGRT